MPTASSNVRFQGQLGKHLLALSFSQLDPKLTSAANADRRAIEAGVMIRAFPTSEFRARSCKAVRICVRKWWARRDSPLPTL